MQSVDKVYGLLVNKVPGIREKYRQKRNCAKGLGRGGVWVYLIWLNMRYYVFRDKKLEHVEKYPYYEDKMLYSRNSESSISCKTAPEKLAEELSEYDVVSFDVFDTLILRPFSEPTDLFFLLADKLKYPDFQRIRQEMEWRARERKYKKSRHYEVNLNEIYTLIEEETGLRKNSSMDMELEVEYENCFANPFMLELLKNLRKVSKQTGTRLVVTSDMYLNTQQIKTILERCGYEKFDAYYVSCDIGKSKSKGDLFDHVKKKEGRTKKFSHVGDNYISDVEQSKKHGFHAHHYVNVNAVGEPYRPYDMSAITGGLYRGTVNAHIHNGLTQYSREYEFGYIYGGLFVTGYCQFIHEYMSRNRVDKILFLARDGDVLSKVYDLLYPEERENWEYVYWSRLAATKMAAGYYKYDYFRRFLYHKVNQGYSLEQIFRAMEIEQLWDESKEILKKAGIQKSEELTDRNIEKVKRYIQKNWKRILEIYAEQIRAGKLYYGKILDGCKKAVAVDIGWAGSGAITLNYVVNQEWKLNCDITGIIAGTNTCHNAEPDATETFLQTGQLISYMYSQRENRDIWKLHDPGKNHNLYWEMLLDAPTGSFKGFYLDAKGGCECRFKDAGANPEKIMEIQRGILDFAEEWKQTEEKLGTKMCKISGRDAYAPMINAMSRVNEEFMKNIAELMDDMNVG